MHKRIHPINELPSTIILGRQTETGVNEVRLDCAEWLALWPELKISVMVTPPGGDSAYPAKTHMESDVLVWTVTEDDTAVAGSGTMEVLGVADGLRKLSAIATTRVLATTTITQGEAPESAKPWVEEVLEAAEQINKDVDVGASVLYIVRATPDPDFHNAPKADRTQEEIRAAVAEGKTVLLVYTELESEYSEAHEARVMTYAGEIVKDSSGNTCPTFDGYIASNSKGIPYYYQAYVQPLGHVGRSGSVLRAATKYPLKITGAVEAEYDGRDTVEVEVPRVFVITTSIQDGMYKTSHTASEIRAAVKNGNAVLLQGGNTVYTFREFVNLNPLLAEFAGYTYIDDEQKVAIEYATVDDSNVVHIYTNHKGIPNPKKLILSGAVTATYDGSEEVEIEIPSGIADPGTAHQQLVSDAEGKAVWVPALAYKMSGDVTILSERTGTPSSDGAVGITKPFEGVVEAGKTYKVNYNGTEYETTGVATEAGNTPDGETIKGVVLGNTAFVGGEDNGLPFVVIYVEPQFQEYIGAYGVILAADGATSVTISITGDGTTYKTIDPVYLPDKRVVTVNATITKMDADSIEFGEWDTTFADMLAAFNAGHEIRVLCTCTHEDNVQTFVGRFDAAWLVTATGNTILRLRVPKGFAMDGEFAAKVGADENGEIVCEQFTFD